MNQSLKDKLLAVPREKLVDLIFDLAGDKDISWSKIERLVSTPSGNSKRFLRRLDDIKNRGGFVPWKYSSKFADELEDLLADLESGIGSPEEGFNLICEFYNADASFFEQADDSSGHIGDVFRGSAIEIFVKFASQISDKRMIIGRMLQLMSDDGYGVRDDLINHSGKFLSESELRDLLQRVESDEAKQDRRYGSWKLESIARQLKDAPLFEKIVRKKNPHPHAKQLVEIANVYFLADDVAKAQEVLDSIQISDDDFHRFEFEELQKKIYARLGKTEDLYRIVYQAFLKSMSEYTLRDLLEVVGQERKAEFLAEAESKILTSSNWSTHDAGFLKFVDRPESLEAFIMKHRVQIQEGIYYSAADIAEYLVEKSRYLPAVLLYRGLIAETLKKAVAKNYHHAVNYLEILDQISPKVHFWDGLVDHTIYLQNLKKKHALKKSLWAKYKP